MDVEPLAATGIASTEAFGSLLRALSYRRRQGVLELLFSRIVYKIIVYDGKIVGVSRVDQTSSHEICTKLLRSGHLRRELAVSALKMNIAPEQLHGLLVGKKCVKNAEFLRAKRSYEMDLLYSLRLFGEGEMEFTPKLVRFNPEISLSVWPGQLLLDLAELSQYDEQFKETFGDMQSDAVMVRRGGTDIRGIAEAEQMILDVLARPLSVSDIRDKCLLSEYELRGALLELHGLGGVVVEYRGAGHVEDEEFREEGGEGAQEDGSGKVPAGAESRKRYGESAEELFSSGLDENSDTLEYENELGEGSVPIETLEPLLAEVRRAALDEEKRGHAPSSVERAAEARSASTRGASDDNQPQRASAEIPRESGSAPAEIVNSESDDLSQHLAERPAFRQRMAEINYRLVQADTVERTVVGATLLFLLVSALASAELIGEWFEALSHWPSL